MSTGSRSTLSAATVERDCLATISLACESSMDSTTTATAFTEDDSDSDNSSNNNDSNNYWCYRNRKQQPQDQVAAVVATTTAAAATDKDPNDALLYYVRLSDCAQSPLTCLDICSVINVTIAPGSSARIPTDVQGNIAVVLHNHSNQPYNVAIGDCVARLICEQPISDNDYDGTNRRGD